MFGSTWQERNTSVRKETVGETEEQKYSATSPLCSNTHTQISIYLLGWSIVTLTYPGALVE